MVSIAQSLKYLGAGAQRVQPIFITVDPARDTPEVLGSYVAYFDPRMLGLAGSEPATKRIAELFKVRYEKVPAADGDPTRYGMDHTASLYLLGPYSEFIAKFAYGLAPREIAKRLGEYLER